jgi:uncharacterized protein YecT (DUF1311 family)
MGQFFLGNTDFGTQAAQISCKDGSNSHEPKENAVEVYPTTEYSPQSYWGTYVLPGTRYYYDRNGRYRGKSSEFGPITQAFWSMVVLVIGGVALAHFILNWLIEAWWFIALLVAASALLASIAGACVAAVKGKALPALMVVLFVASAIATAALVYFELLPNLAANERALVAARSHNALTVGSKGDHWHPEHIESSGNGSAPAATDSGNQKSDSVGLPTQSQRAVDDHSSASFNSNRLSSQNESSEANLPAEQTVNCHRPAASIEKLICSDEELLKLDARLGALYHQALDHAESPRQIRYAQQSWVYNKRNQCGDRACLMDAYTKRNAELSTGSDK